MKKINDTFIKIIIALSVLLIVSIMVIILGVIIINDLSDTIDMHINSRNTCQYDLRQVKDEYEELAKICEK